MAVGAAGVSQDEPMKGSDRQKMGRKRQLDQSTLFERYHEAASVGMSNMQRDTSRQANTQKCGLRCACCSTCAIQAPQRI